MKHRERLFRVEARQRETGERKSWVYTWAVMETTAALAIEKAQKSHRDASGEWSAEEDEEGIIKAGTRRE